MRYRNPYSTEDHDVAPRSMAHAFLVALSTKGPPEDPDQPLKAFLFDNAASIIDYLQVQPDESATNAHDYAELLSRSITAPEQPDLLSTDALADQLEALIVRHQITGATPATRALAQDLMATLRAQVLDLIDTQTGWRFQRQERRR